MLLSVLPSVVVLGLAALAAAWLAVNRPSPPGNVAQRLRAARVLAVAVVVQSVHFIEEAATGFHHRLGALLELPAMPLAFFVAFNLTWIGIWLVSIAGLRSARAVAFFSAWFLAIAGMFNGVAHPLLALFQGGYFPGLWSSPVIAVASLWLWLRLRDASRHRPADRPPQQA